MASKTHNKFNLRNKITENVVALVISIFLRGFILHHLILLHIFVESLKQLVMGTSILYHPE